MPEMEEESVYKVKRVEFFGRNQVPIVMQNQNGPCPLLAIANVLLLRDSISLPEAAVEIPVTRLLSLVVERLLDSNSSTEGKPEHYVQNQHQNISDAMSVVPRLATGIDVNVKFGSVFDFEFTPETAIFDLLDISMVHGWLLDPQDTATVNAVGAQSYNGLVERLLPHPEAMAALQTHSYDPNGAGAPQPISDSNAGNAAAQNTDAEGSSAEAPRESTSASTGLKEESRGASPAMNVEQDIGGGLTEQGRGVEMRVEPTSADVSCETQSERESVSQSESDTALGSFVIVGSESEIHLERNAPSDSLNESGQGKDGGTVGSVNPGLNEGAGHSRAVELGSGLPEGGDGGLVSSGDVAPGVEATVRIETEAHKEQEAGTAISPDAAQSSGAAAQKQSDVAQSQSGAAQVQSGAAQVQSDAAQVQSGAAQVHADAAQVQSGAAPMQARAAGPAEGGMPPPAPMGEDVALTEALLISNFLTETASQLTYHGLFSLQESLKDQQLCVFFRNNHFSTLFKRQGDLYLLVTDQGYLNQPGVVWERLSEVEGNNQFVSGDFSRFVAVQDGDDGTSNQWTAEDDAAIAAVVAAEMNMLPEQPAVQGSTFSSDLELAMALQQQEEDQVRRSTTSAVQPASRTTNPQHPGTHYPTNHAYPGAHQGYGGIPAGSSLDSKRAARINHPGVRMQTETESLQSSSSAGAGGSSTWSSGSWFASGPKEQPPQPGPGSPPGYHHGRRAPKNTNAQQRKPKQEQSPDCSIM